MEYVPIIEVDSNNFAQLWPSIVSAIKDATFIAVDHELSGLGNRKLLSAKSAEERYKSICNTAKTRSIISTGISCFKLLPSDDNMDCDASKARHLKYYVQTFSLFVLCKDYYTVEPASLKFLVHHGFDFNRQYAFGLPYFRDISEEKYSNLMQPSLQNLFGHIILSKKPLILHNALVDLVFLYESFHASTPSTLGNFLADLTQIFPGGVFDTKFITEFKARLPASYLEYVFRRCQRDNREATEKSWSCIDITCPVEHDEHVIRLPCALLTTDDAHDGEVCQQYANHGWCPNSQSCSKSHNIDHILSHEGQNSAKKQRRRNRKKKQATNSDSTCMETTDSPPVTPTDKLGQDISENVSDMENLNPDSHANLTRSRVEGHRAGFDAFMTGFAFAFYTCRYSKNTEICAEGRYLLYEDFANKVYLGGKDIPLQLVKSAFAKFSKNHLDRMEHLKMLNK